VRRSSLVIFETTGDGIDDVARRIRRIPGVEAAAVFGHALRVAGTDREQLRRTAGSFAGFDWHEAEPRLEDVFIHQLAARESAR
jgi:ABC-2 type transport system ATP-binding protein